MLFSVFGVVLSVVVMIGFVSLFNASASPLPIRTRIVVGEMEFVFFMWIVLALMVFISILTIVVLLISTLFTSLLFINSITIRIPKRLLLFTVETVMFSSG